MDPDETGRSIRLPLSQSGPSHSDTVARALLIGLLCAIPALLCFHSAGGSIADPDVGWHLRTGEWILQHHAFPHADPFSRVIGGSAWQAYSWLFDLVLLKFYASLQLKGLVVFTAAMMTLIAAALYHMTSRLQTDLMKRVLLTAGAMTCIACAGTPRPWLFSMLFFVLELDILMFARQDGRSREMLWLPLLFALWANVHIQFIDGLLVLAMAACEPFLARWWKSGVHSPPVSSYLLALGASAAAACFNPYGPGIYRIAWQLGSQSGVLDTVRELQALPFRTWSDYLLLFMALAAAGVLFRFRQLAPFETLLLAMAAVLSFRSRRDLWVIAFAAAAILAAGLPGRPDQQEPERRPLWAPLLTALTTAAVFLGSAAWLGLDNAQLEALLAKKMPVQAVEVMQARHYTGPLFNTYDWGGYLIWKLREPVSMDGRAALYGDARIDRSLKTWNGGPDWAEDPDLKSAAVILAPHAAALTQLLQTDRRFAVAYQDDVATVFIVRKGQSARSDRADLGEIAGRMTSVTASSGPDQLPQ
jgi:hypothetical protein